MLLHLLKRFGAWGQHSRRLWRKERLLILLLIIGHGYNLARGLLESEDGVDERGRWRLLNLLVTGRPGKQNLRLLLRH